MNRNRLKLVVVLATGLLLTASAVLAETTKTIRGTAHADTIHGTAGADTIYGLGGNDTIYGGAGNDKIYGGAGNDHLYGGAGDDLIVAGPGADVISCGPGNDTVVGDAHDKAGKDCEHVRGIPTATPPPPPAPPPPAPPPPAPPPPAIQAGTYCGFTEQGPGLCVTTDGTNVTGFQTSAIVDCQDGSRWTWTVTFTDSGVPLQSDNSFSYSYNGPLTSSSADLANIQENEFIKGVFTADGKATGTLALTTISYDYQGTHYSCTQNPVSWHVAKQ